jgi:hypothetical protein
VRLDRGRRVLLGGLVALLVGVLAGAAYARHLLRALDTPAFRAALLARAKETVGADVRVKEMDVALLSGLTLHGLEVANPAPFTGKLLTADAFVLRYRLLPLLAGRVEVERLSLQEPALALAVDARGAFNYERLGGAARRTPAAAAPAALPLRIALRRLSADRASIVMTDHTRARLLAIEGLDLSSAFEIEGGVARGRGEATAALADLAGVLFLRSLRAPLEASRESVRLSPVRARLAGGEATGHLTVRLQGGFRYVADLEVTRAEVKTLLAEARSAAGLAGSLRAKARFEGTGGLATVRGRGDGRIDACRVRDARTLALLAEALGVPELANPDLDECRFEFVQTGRSLSTPVVSLTGRALRLTGRGTVNLATGALDYAMRLALAPKLMAKVTRPELRTAFVAQEDGFSAIDFRLSGTTAEPKTDLLARLGKAAAVEAIRGKLGGLLGTKRPEP